jgi:aminopeptidase N
MNAAVHCSDDSPIASHHSCCHTFLQHGLVSWRILRTILRIHVQIGLVGPDGQDLPLHLKATAHNSKHKLGKNSTTKGTNSKPVTSPEGLIHNTGLQGRTSSSLVLLVDSWSQSFTFTRLPDKPYVSLLRDFSAPVRLEVEGETDRALGFLAVHDNNPFAR